MTSEMTFECLFVSRDPELFRTISSILRELSISVQICLRPAKAFDFLATSQSDLVVIDWEGDGSSEFLQKIWQQKKSKKPTLVAVSSNNSRVAGAHIVIKKPVSRESALHSLRTAYRYMLVEHRKNARHALMMPVTARVPSGQEIEAIVTDIGDGGLGLCSRQALEVGDVLPIQLALPETPRKILIQARVVWTRDFGRAGCEFVRIPPVDLMILNEWLKSRSIVKKPQLAV